MKLLLDLGNTRLKWAWAGTRLGEVNALAWDHPNLADALHEAWHHQPPPARLLAACVTTPARAAGLEQVLTSLGWPAPPWLQSPASRGRLHNAYGEPADLGIDRFLAMLAALEAGLAPCIVVACGSAITLDALDADGRHLGGEILPGLGAMHGGLLAVAPGLANAGPGHCVSLPRGTADAIASGIVHAAVAAIEAFADRAAHAMGTAPGLVMCGGDAARLATQLAVEPALLHDAVLRGLLAWEQGRA